MYLFRAQIIDGTIENYVTRYKQLHVRVTNIMGIVNERLLVVQTLCIPVTELHIFGFIFGDSGLNIRKTEN